MGDNPVQESVFDKIMGQDKKNLSFLFDTEDKYNILDRPDKFKFFGPEAGKDVPGYAPGNLSKDLGKSLTERFNLSPTKIGVGLRRKSSGLFGHFEGPVKGDLGSLFQSITNKFGVEFAFNSSGNELYMLSESAQTQVALPLQYIADDLESGLVHMGGTSRGAYRAGFFRDKREYTFAELFYENLQKLVDKNISKQEFLKQAARISDTVIAKGIKGDIRLRTLLGPPTNIRGTPKTTLAAKNFAMRKRVGTRVGEELHWSHAAFQDFKDAKRVINTLTKTSGTALPMLFKQEPRGPKVPSWLRLDMTAGQAVRAAFAQEKMFYANLVKLAREQGYADHHYMIKPEFFTGEKGFIQPSNMGMAMMGPAQSDRERIKGGFQEYHASRFTERQQGNIISRGGNTKPSYMRTADFAARSGKDVFYKRSIPVASLHYRDKVSAMLLTGDSGAISTSLGAQMDASVQHLGGFKLTGVGKNTLKALQFFTTRSNPRTELLGRRAHFIMPEDVAMARTVKGSEGYVKYKDLTEAGKRIRGIIRAAGRHSGVFDSIAEFGSPFTISSKYSGGDVTLNFHSANLIESPIQEILLGNTRLTAATVHETHWASRGIQALGSLGIEKGVDSDIVGSTFKRAKKEGKMRPLSSALSQFFGVMESQGRLAEAIGIVEGDRGIVREVMVPGHTDPQSIHTLDANIALVTDEKEAVAHVARYLTTLRATRLRKNLRLAHEIEHGKRISSTVHGLTDVVKSVRKVYRDLSLRSEDKLDLNAVKGSKITMGKVRTMAWASKMLGYGDAMDDPVFATMVKGHSGGFGFNGKIMDFEFGEASNVREYISSLASNRAPTSGILRHTSQGLELDGVLLKNIPAAASFASHKGGVDPTDLLGTALDPKYADRVFHLDLGSSTTVSDLLPNDLRYLPVPMMFSRIRESKGSVKVNPKHPFYDYLEVLHQYQINGPSAVSRLAKSMANAVSVTLNAMIGKTGLVAKTNIIHLNSSISGRLVPDRAGVWTRESSFDPSKFFDIRVSEQAFTTQYLKKLGYKDQEIGIVQKLVKERASSGNFMYVMMGVDPAQRGEHLGNVHRLFFTQDSIGKDGALGINVNPILESSMERDRDKDRAVLHMIEAMMGRSPETTAALASRLERQSMQISPMLAFMKHAQSGPLAGTQALDSILSAIDVQAQYVGQKTWSSGGYTIARPDERIMSVLINEGIEGLEKRNLKTGGLSGPRVEEIQAMFRGQPVKEGAASALNQYMFQSGVGKGTEKGSLEKLIIEHMDLGDRVRTKGFLDIGDIVGSGDDLTQMEKVYLNFIESSSKDRLWQATEHLLQDSGVDLDSLGRVQAGLAQGAEAATITAMYHSKAKRAAARLMAQGIGIPTAVAALTGSVKNVSAIAEDSTKISSVRDFMTRLVGPITGDWGRAPGTGLASEILSQVSQGPGVTSPSPGQSIKETTTSVLNNVKKLANSKYFVPAAIGVGALAAYGYANRPSLQSDSLPPPTDTSRPMDRGPNLPDYSNVARVNSSNFIPPASRSRSNNRLSNVNGQFFNARTDSRVVIEDKMSPSNPWLVRQQMNRVSESDFVY